MRLPAETRSRFGVRHPSLTEYFTGRFPAPALNAESSAAETQIANVVRCERLAEASRDTHNRICDRYLTAWGGLDRQLAELETNPELGGMDGGYALRWLTWHLLAADREADLHSLLACGREGQNTWFAAHDRLGDVTGYLRDVGRARNSTQRLGMQLRYALSRRAWHRYRPRSRQS